MILEEKDLKKVSIQVWYQVWWQVRDQVESQVTYQVTDQFDNQISNKFLLQIFYHIRDNLQILINYDS